MQETVVGWDLRSMWNGPPWYYTVWLFYWLGAEVVLLVWLAQLWRALGISNKKSARVLEEALSTSRKDPACDITAIVQRLSPRSPEAGLRQLVRGGLMQHAESFQKADAEFRKALEPLREKVNFLLTLMWLTALVYFWSLVNGIHSFLDLMWREKSPSIRIAIGSAYESLPPFGLFALFFLLVGLAHRHMSNRLQSREASWERSSSWVSRSVS